ncbi:MAG TPA: hypothetical protein VIT91_14575, partial [Chthoniobacterales bacterium]
LKAFLEGASLSRFLGNMAKKDTHSSKKAFSVSSAFFCSTKIGNAATDVWNPIFEIYNTKRESASE